MSNIPSREEVEAAIASFGDVFQLDHDDLQEIAGLYVAASQANRILKALWEEWNAANWRYADDPAEALDKAMTAASALYEGKP